MKRTNFPDRKNQRRKEAVERLEARLKLSDNELVSTAKRFKNTIPDKKEMDSYRDFLKKSIDSTQKKVYG